MSLPQGYIDASVAAVLAVNLYGLEKSYRLLPALRDIGLTDPAYVSKIDVTNLMMQLHEAGYHRGLLTEMMAGRLLALMVAINEGKLEDLGSFIATDDKQRAIELLCTVKGIGPKVADDIWMLTTE